MTTKEDKDNSGSGRFYRGKSLRLPKHDYSWTGAYFVTVCATTREPIFEIPPLHAIMQETWNALPKRFSGVTLDEFVIMPDHIHGLLWLNGLSPNAPTLSRVIGAYKSITAVAWFNHCKSTGIDGGGSFWLSRFHERVMRDGNEVAIYRNYIRRNPEKLERREY
ncbi:MAG TPA: transposase [Ktedonobacteraceae bacterium]|nr:transposase [Ktedonobacteraceae bacterium]